MDRETVGVLATLAELDWVAPTTALIRCIVGGWRPISIYWNQRAPADCQRILGRHGIRSRGGVVTQEGFIILVQREEIDDARTVLGKYGVPLA